MEIPYWWIEAQPEDGPAKSPRDRCDAAVIGAGYTGLAAAIVLARAGRDVQVFDSLRPGEGASTRNGGIASGNLRYSMTVAIKTFGLEAAVALFREGQAARADLADFIRVENVDCDYQPTGRFTGAINKYQLEEQKRETALLDKHLGIDAHVVGPEELGTEIVTDQYCGGLVREDLASLHPAKLHAGMMRVAASAGVSVFGQSPVSDYYRNGEFFELKTGGRTIRARNLIVATNGYTGAADPWLRRRLVPVVSRVVVTGELPTGLVDTLLPKRRAMGENRKIFRYFRPTPDGKRILLGSRERMLPASPAKNAAHVFAGLVEIFPALEPYGFDYSWNGNIAISRDEMPGLFVKDGMIYASGYCGSGVVWARWLGGLAGQFALSGCEPQSQFASSPPPAIPFFRGKPWFLPAFMAYYAWQDRRSADR